MQILVAKQALKSDQADAFAESVHHEGDGSGRVV
jgi:hypothetical protein